MKLFELIEKDHHVFYISLSRNFGHQIAITAGLDASKGKVVVFIDGDLQDPPELIIDFYKKYKEGYEVVYAKRKERKGDHFLKKSTAKFFYRMLKQITSIDIPLDTGDFRLIDEKVIHYLKHMPEQNKFLRGQIAWLGFKQTEVLFSRDKRKYGKSGYSLNKLTRLAIDGFTSFSDKPLHLATKLGLIILFVLFIVLLYTLYSHYILERTITVWIALVISLMFIGGTQLISIGIIGEYISRINKNVLKRPLYIVEKSNIDPKACTSVAADRDRTSSVR